MKILGISRSPRFSPNSVNRDSAIFSSVVSQLLRKNNDVSTISEDLFVAVDLSDFDFVFSMARDMEVLKVLAEEEQNGKITIINSAISLLKMNRFALVDLFQQQNIPQPNTFIINTVGTIDSTELKFPCWLKRGDSCAQSADDVVYVESLETMINALNKFAANDVQKVLVVEHLTGDLIKFYGVEGGPFFHFSYPKEKAGYSKYGLEKYNDEPKFIDFDAGNLKKISDCAARATGYTVYGGDAVVNNDGTFKIIDFNDWPSFSPCRKEAAKAIVKRIFL